MKKNPPAAEAEPYNDPTLPSQQGGAEQAMHNPTHQAQLNHGHTDEIHTNLRWRPIMMRMRQRWRSIISIRIMRRMLVRRRRRAPASPVSIPRMSMRPRVGSSPRTSSARVRRGSPSRVSPRRTWRRPTRRRPRRPRAPRWRRRGRRRGIPVMRRGRAPRVCIRSRACGRRLPPRIAIGRAAGGGCAGRRGRRVRHLIRRVRRIRVRTGVCARVVRRAWGWGRAGVAV